MIILVNCGMFQVFNNNKTTKAKNILKLPIYTIVLSFNIYRLKYIVTYT